MSKTQPQRQIEQDSVRDGCVLGCQNTGYLEISSSTVAFEGSFTDGTTHGTGVFEILNGQIVPVVMEGQAAPDEPGSTFVNIRAVSRINGAGDFAFVTGLTGHPTFFQAMYATSGTTLYRIVDTNTAAPAMPGYNFQAFNIHCRLV